MSWWDRIEGALLQRLTPLAPRLARLAPVDERGQPLDPHVALLAHAARVLTVPVSRLTPDGFRESSRRQLALIDRPVPAEVPQEELVVPGPDGVSLAARLYSPPAGVEPRALMVGLHEGGWVIGGLHTNATLFARIAQAGVAVLDVDYRHAPEEPWPAAFRDGLAAWRWARAEAEPRLGLSPDRVGVGGASAGATTSAAICIHERDRGLPLPAFQLLVYPMIDATCRTGSMISMADAFPLSLDLFYWFMDRVAPSPAMRKDLRMSPGRSKTLAGLPPAVMAVAGFDVLRDQALEYAARLVTDGGRCDVLHFPTLSHSFAAMSGAVPAAAAAIDRIAGAVRRCAAPPE